MRVLVWLSFIVVLSITMVKSMGAMAYDKTNAETTESPGIRKEIDYSIQGNMQKTITLTDIDGNVYTAVTIGSQIWMAENLRVTKYRNGDVINTTIPYNLDISGKGEPKYQWAYKGNESNVAIYGRLYTWYTVTDHRGICPAGWHVPTDDEWTILENYLIVNGYNYDETTTGII